ncbi:hypothetical protein COCNU_15G006350 [Cocos nucifera]|uniref:Uncharacterized protein n=1 Tax=Cocos nucifera TaxID=13894 RepID=A0A8K0ND32_COCNU|nr:hypothetical protein COCNU_15G006350 [Cocos nucifera]
MASNFVNAGEQREEEHNHHHHQVPSPRTIRRTWSSNPSSCGHGSATTVPKCVCAPATHARSFKCRLHRVNTQGHSQPSTPAPAVSTTSSTWTVEAQ